MGDGLKVAVVTARSAPGASGGAERFYNALTEAFCEAGHQAKEVPIIADESTYDHILRNYLNCYDLDLSTYDLVVSTKAPTWMVRHPRHVCYLVHTIRVFYDMYDIAFSKDEPEAAPQRDLIHKMDCLALSNSACRAIFAIGNEVADRLKTWNGLHADVIHPPLWSGRFRTGSSEDYLLLPGRLHAWKRVDLIIRAMRHVKSPLRLIITGTGEAEEELKALASTDSRIEFHGRVSDNELVNLYAGAFAVPFAPKREDYGYVTVEAYASGKPVITCTDSGEAAALVQHDKTGYVCKPEPEDVARYIDRLWKNRSLAEVFGCRGRKWVQRKSWADVVQRLVDA